MSVARKREGLGFLRFIMVLASISPLFVLWAIRGTCQLPSAPCQLSGVPSQAPKETCLLPNNAFLIGCVIFIVVPNLLLLWRLRTAQKHRDTREVLVGKAEDHRDHLLVYLFAMLLPFYATNLTSWREFSATLLAVCFIVFLFWNCNLHYMNVLFAVFGYRIFTINPPDDRNPLSGRESVVLITRRATIFPGERILPYRLSNSVYWEVD
jgi:hypothetical protein